MSSQLTRSANQFAVELFQCYLRRHGDKYRNLLLCPYLIYHSLAMMLVGAKGNTADQLMKVLHMSDLNAGGGSSSSSSSSGRHQLNLRRIEQITRTASNSSASTISGARSSVSSLSPNERQRHVSSPSPVRRNGSTSRRKSRRDGPIPRSRSQFDLNLSLKSSRRELTPDGPNESRHRDFLWLTEQLLHGNHEFVHQASFIYLDKGTKRTERYKAVLRDYYETKPKKIDFDNVDLMVKTINEDVARTTENIYHDILSHAEAQKLEKSYMLLVNAVFFRGFWLSNFTEVKKAPFIKYPSGSSGTKSVEYTVNMMSKLDYLSVVEDAGLDARLVRMQFEASDLQMLLVLPNNERSDSTYLCEKISADKIELLLNQLSSARARTVRVTMPVFCIDSGKISIQSTLVQMGASDLFDKKAANMSGVCENKPVWLHKIIHRCFIICDNRGSITSSGYEKARRRQAQQVVAEATKRTGETQFCANHPFMYIIFDSLTKTVLLMGLYTDPSETLELIHENQLSAEEAHQIYTEGVYKT